MKPISCPEVDRALWLYIDRELSAGELQAISSHLKQCETCRGTYHDRAREASQYRMAFLDSPFGDKFVAKLERRMIEEGLLRESARRDDVSGGSDVRGGGGGRHSWRRREGTKDKDMDDTEALPPGPGVRRGVRPRRGRFFDVRSAHFRRRFLRVATVAAMIILIPAVVIIGKKFNGLAPEDLGTLSMESGTFSILRANMPGTQPVVPEGHRMTRLNAGLVYELPANAVAHLRLAAAARPDAGDPEGPPPEPAAEIVLRGPAVLALDPQTTRRNFHATLEEGIFEATVAHRDPLEPFVVDTPYARASVVGTRFTLTATDEETRLAVAEGKVKFQKRDALPGARGSEVTRESGLFSIRRGGDGPVPVVAADRAVSLPIASPPTVPLPIASPPTASPLTAASGPDDSDGARPQPAATGSVGPATDAGASKALPSPPHDPPRPPDLDNPVDGGPKPVR